MKIFHYLHRLRRLPFSILPRFILFRFKKLFFEIIEFFIYSVDAGSANKEFKNNLLIRPLHLLHPDVLSVGFGELFKNEFPSDAEKIIQIADHARDLKVDLLGSGLVDLKTIENGKIPWHFDFKSGHRWPKNLFFSKIKIKLNPGVDIKVPWELSRCSHFVSLGQAYRLTNDEKYAKAFFYQIDDWIRENPVKYGVNWVCPMDVALRGCNWLLAWEFFADSPSKPSNLETRLFKSLLEHGKHIRRHLEWGADVSSNHYLANLAGLAYLGCALQQKEWASFAKKEIENEIKSQTFEDGIDYETSTGYHRLVLELFFFSSMALEKCVGGSVILNAEFKTRLRKMFSSIISLATHNGEMPLIGDNDSGRMHVLLKRSDADIRYLSSLGALCFKEGELKVEEWGACSELVWFYGLSGLGLFKALPGIKSSAIPSKKAGPSGLAVLRKNGVLTFSAQPNGIRGVGAHTHNDKLSFTLASDWEWFIIDPGTYLYTPDPEKRDLFRSTRMHNTVEVDNQEQNRFRSGNLFLLCEDSKLVVEKEIPGEEIVAYHTGYRRLSDPVTTKRRIVAEKEGWLVEDEINGNNIHDLIWTFVLAPHVVPKTINDGCLTLEGTMGAIDFSCSPDLKFQIEEGFFSPAYGKSIPTKILRVCRQVVLPYRASFQIKMKTTASV